MAEAAGVGLGLARKALQRLAGRGPADVPVEVVEDGSAPEPALFRDIQVIPPAAPYAPGRARTGDAMSGGPVWPDFASQTWVRFSARGRLMDRRPEPVSRCAKVIDGPCLWIGYAKPHFGHLIAEHMGRLLWSRTLRPRDPCLLVAAPGTQAGDLPSYLWDVLAWYGLNRRDAVLVTAPTLARQLRVLPQAETLKGPGPDAAYVELLGRNAARNGLKPIRSEVLYVSRLGMIERRKDAQVGEAYLARRLEAAGARHLDPASAPLREQLALYAGARTIVFAEGSAVHGRQLLGRVDQRIVVLNRRRGGAIARAALLPRATVIDHVEATRALCAPRLARSPDLLRSTLSFYDLEALIGGLARHGIDLSAGWSDADYRAACEADVAAWSAMIRRHPDRFAVEPSLAALDAVPPGPVPDASGPWHRSLAHLI